MAWTNDQIKAINEEGSNIIVSAGAGSGKTAVLTERVIRKLKSGVDVNKLLILTFTKEAAGEMKSRIRASIIKNKLDKQLKLLDSAYITTFDSYANSLVKKYHYLHNISDNFKIVDSSIITIYKYNILENMFLNLYGTEDFDKFISDYCYKDDDNVKKLIISLSSKLDLLPNKEEYLDNYITSYYSEENISNLIDTYLNLIRDKINELKDLYDNFLSYAPSNLIDKLNTYFKPLFNSNTYDDWVLFKTLPTIRFMGVPEEVKDLAEDIKVKKDEIKELLRFDEVSEIKDSILKTKEYATVIIKIIKELDEKVNEYKNKMEAYEFTDIAKMAIKTVKDYPDIRNEIKNYFNEIMVDEYQDTSDLQEEFLSYIDNANIYMVGDIKQSIYRFRNANPYIFQNKYESYSRHNNGIKIDLLKNFRSRKEVLDAINNIFNNIMDNDIGGANYQLEHNMVAGNTDYDEYKKDNNELEIYNYLDNEEDKKEEIELFIVSNDIKEKIKNKYKVYDKDKKCLRDITYNDICIITDRNKYFDTYKKILEYHEIPSTVYTDIKITEDMVYMVIKNLFNLVYTIKNNILDDKFRYYYTSVARSFLFSYSDNTIYQLNKDKAFKNDQIFKLCLDLDINNPLPNILYDIINKFDVYDKLNNLANIERNILTISNIIEIAKSVNDLGYSYHDFLEYLDILSDLDLDIKYNVSTKAENAVKIMNIHKSKGLEFSLCYFVGMANEFNYQDIKTKTLFSNKYGLVLPYSKDDTLTDTIVKDLCTNDYYKEEVSEKIRLLYVALTRCKEKMIIVAQLNSEKTKYNNLVPSNIRKGYKSFLDILNSLNIINKYIVNKDYKVDSKYNKVKLKDITNNDYHEKISIKKINMEYKIIDNKHYSHEEINLIDSFDIKSMEYGTSIHKIFEYDDFYNPKSTYVKDFLKNVPNNFINIYHEYEFYDRIDDTEYHGIIDLILEYDTDIYIIDYKLKDIDNPDYLKQIKGYKEHIRKITNKNIKTYLYSIKDNILKEVL